MKFFCNPFLLFVSTNFLLSIPGGVFSLPVSHKIDKDVMIEHNILNVMIPISNKLVYTFQIRYFHFLFIPIYMASQPNL